MLRHIEALTSIILTHYVGDLFRKHRTVVKAFFSKIEVRVAERGIEDTVKYVKISRLAVTRYIAGEPLGQLEGVALKDGWPVWLADLKELTHSTQEKAILLTLLTVLRGIVLKPKLDVTPIISPWKGSDSITEKEFNHACRQLGISPKPSSWDRPHMSTKSGPQGQALTASVTELTLLPQELITSIKLLGGDKLGKVIDGLLLTRWGSHSLASIWSTIFKAKSTLFRKVTYFGDKEGKTRVIAILDYWSQTCLRPYHDTLNGILRRIKADCTFDQNSMFSTLPRLGPYSSLDLSNATDRMPFALQRRVFSRVFGEEKASAWAHVLIGYEYAIKGGPAVKYGAGQPMGAYSSWCSMALTHHLIVRVSALRAGFPHFRAYCLLGDDLVIANDCVAQEYRKLCATLDMPISEQKTHVSKDTFEFAKRWFVNGVEFTGFGISGLFSVWKAYALLHNYLATQAHHGWSLDAGRHPGLISAIYELFGKSEQSARVVKLYMVFDAIPHKGIPYENHQYALLAERILEYFGKESSWSIVRPVQQDWYRAIGYKSLLAAKKAIVERDMGRFQKDASSISRKLNRSFKKFFPSLSVRDYRAALGDHSPLILVLNGMIMDSAKVLRESYGKGVVYTHASGTFGGNVMAAAGTGSPVDETYLNVGLSKYFVSKGVFTMRASHSISLSQAQMVKLILKQFELRVGLELTDLLDKPLQVIEEPRAPFVPKANPQPRLPKVICLPGPGHVHS